MKSIIFSLIGVVMGLFLLSGAFAWNFTVEVLYPDKIIAGEKGTVKVKITNYDKGGYFYITSIGTRPEWIVLEKMNIYVEEDSSRIVKIYFKPSETALEAIYRIKVIVRADDETKIEKVVPLKVEQPEEIKISDLQVFPSLVKPGESVKASLEISNLGRDEKSFIVKFYLDNVEKKITTIVKGRTKKIVKASFNITQYRAPEKLSIFVEVIKNGEVIAKKTGEFTVQKIEKIEAHQKESVNILYRSVNIYAKNVGNVEKTFSVQSNATNAWYVLYTGPSPDLKGDYYVWNVVLEPGEEKVISYKEIYWPTIAVPILIVILFVYYKFFYLGFVRLRKSVIYKKPVREGDTVSVYLEVKNGIYPAKNIVITDFVPASFELVKSFETIKPVRKKTEDGVQLKWRIRSLKPFEEIVLHYRIKPKIGIIGSLKLPCGEMTCKIKKRIIHKSSNSPNIIGIKG